MKNLALNLLAVITLIAVILLFDYLTHDLGAFLCAVRGSSR
jgi:hypothetical protein